MTKNSRLRRIRGDVGEGDDYECQEDEDNDVNEDDKMEKSASRKVGDEEEDVVVGEMTSRRRGRRGL